MNKIDRITIIQLLIKVLLKSMDEEQDDMIEIPTKNYLSINSHLFT